MFRTECSRKNCCFDASDWLVYGELKWFRNPTYPFQNKTERLLLWINWIFEVSREEFQQNEFRCAVPIDLFWLQFYSSIYIDINNKCIELPG